MTPSSPTMTGSATFYTYSHVWCAASSLLKSAKEHSVGSNHCRVSAVLFSAFAVEACLNHLGEKEEEEGRLPHWHIIERKLSPHEKLDLLSLHFRIEIDRGQRPFQTLHELFKFRDNLAHGKTCEVPGSYEEGTDSEKNIMDPPWFSRWYSDEAVQRAVNDSREVIERLLKGARLPAHYLMLNASGCYCEG
jgi:hypothetical protein